MFSQLRYFKGAKLGMKPPAQANPSKGGQKRGSSGTQENSSASKPKKKYARSLEEKWKKDKDWLIFDYSKDLMTCKSLH